MNWLTDFVRPKVKKITAKEIADNLWTKCPNCGQMLFNKELEKNNFVCHKCDHHLRLSVKKRLELLFDNGEYKEIFLPKLKEDPLNFKDSKKYTDRLKTYRKNTGDDDAIKVAQGEIGGITSVVAVMDFAFMGGSMGMAVGEGIVKSFAEGSQIVGKGCGKQEVGIEIQQQKCDIDNRENQHQHQAVPSTPHFVFQIGPGIFLGFVRFVYHNGFSSLFVSTATIAKDVPDCNSV